ncbi:hypothetical protein EVAR_92372_1 [Eumeta japonica]|uniref:Uncharacterized protein n=1 Tax=Eumeta variegata TaxID=151549 RepID=A0A4C1TLA0_EUMVA|nr:hypothetical protein EVAR_92372_1 [Eumeta japonica]
MRRFKVPGPVLHLPRAPILSHCDAFVPNFTAAVSYALADSRLSQFFSRKQTSYPTAISLALFDLFTRCVFHFPTAATPNVAPIKRG